MTIRATRASLPWLSRAVYAAALASSVTLFMAVRTCAEEIAVVDATGRRITIAGSSRIVSIGGATTEILYALGVEDRVVAVDSTSVYPKRALAEKPNVGYMRRLSPEGVLSRSPTLILATEGAGPKDAVAVLEAARVTFVQIPDHSTPEGVIEKINLIAEATGRREQGRCLAAATQADFDALAAQRSRTAKPLRVLYVLSFVNGRPMVAGTDTAADNAIALAGAVNAISGVNGYKPVNDEAVIAAKPDVVVAMERPQQMYAAETVFANPAFAMTLAASHKRFLSMDGQYLLSFGPRTARAVRDLATYLYPEMASGPLPSESGSDGPCL